MKKRLVITGMGAVTPIGIGVEEYWRNLLAGQCGVDTISRCPAKLPPKSGILSHLRPCPGK